jgi:hypothetical protein
MMQRIRFGVWTSLSLTRQARQRARRSGFGGGAAGATNLLSVSKNGLLDSSFTDGGLEWMLRMTSSTGGSYGFVAVDANSVKLVVNGNNTSDAAAFRFGASPYSFQVPRGLLLGNLSGTSVFLTNASQANLLQLGENHATTPTLQTIKGHNVTTGTGADLLLSGGTGSVANGMVRIGTHSAIGAETVTGYIEIKDAGGTVRKLAVVS